MRYSFHYSEKEEPAEKDQRSNFINQQKRHPSDGATKGQGKRIVIKNNQVH